MKTWRLLIKAVLLFAFINFVLVAVSPGKGSSVSVYNHLVPGRVRLPFGENAAAAYNLSLFDIDAMFAAHEIAAPKADNEFRVVVVGDSSVWGTLLRPEETLIGQLNTLGLESADGRAMRFYNAGYPTISLTKDLLIFEEATQYEPDLIVWMMTLESFPADKQLSVPLVSHNPARVERLATAYDLNLDLNSDALIRPGFWDTTLIGRRRALADWYRLQVYGLMWALPASIRHTLKPISLPRLILKTTIPSMSGLRPYSPFTNWHWMHWMPVTNLLVRPRLSLSMSRS